MHPLVRLLVVRPQLAADHVSAYADLLAEEAGSWAWSWRARLAWQAFAALCLTVAATLFGVALIVWGVRPATGPMPPGWWWAVPVVPLLCGLWAVWRSRGIEQRDGLAVLRRQLAADAAMLREVDAA